MATNGANKVYVQLATRIQVTLLQRVKLYCVEHDVTVMRFVEEAIGRKLRRSRIRGI